MIVQMSLLLAGCVEQDAGYFPLMEGYQWRYQIHLSAAGAREVQKYYSTSTQARKLDGDTVFVRQSLTGTETLYRQTESGIERIAYNFREGQTEKLIEDRALLIPYKLAVGTEWKGLLQIRKSSVGNKAEGDGISGAFVEIPVVSSIVSNTAVVKVPAGRFTACLEIQTSGFAFYSTENGSRRALIKINETNWYARGVGLIKSLREESNTSSALLTSERRMELQSYSEPAGILQSYISKLAI